MTIKNMEEIKEDSSSPSKDSNDSMNNPQDNEALNTTAPGIDESEQMLTIPPNLALPHVNYNYQLEDPESQPIKKVQ